MTEVLVLNSAYIPIRTVSDRESICLIYSNKAYSVIESDRVIRSPSITFKVPTVIALIGYSAFPKKKVGFSKLNVIYRDDCTCMHCGKQFSMNDLTIDHIIPRSRWAKEKHTHKNDWSTFLNCTTLCRWCNNAKGNKLLHELGWKLLREPYEPEYLPHIVVTLQKAEALGWLPFCKVNVRVINILP